MKQTEILTHATHVNGWEPAVYMSCMSQNFRLFHVSNLSVRNFRIFLLMYPGPVTDGAGGTPRCRHGDNGTHRHRQRLPLTLPTPASPRLAPSCVIVALYGEETQDDPGFAQCPGIRSSPVPRACACLSDKLIGITLGPKVAGADGFNPSPPGLLAHP